MKSLTIKSGIIFLPTIGKNMDMPNYIDSLGSLVKRTQESASAGQGFKLPVSKLRTIIHVANAWLSD